MPKHSRSQQRLEKRPMVDITLSHSVKSCYCQLCMQSERRLWSGKACRVQCPLKTPERGKRGGGRKRETERMFGKLSAQLDSSGVVKNANLPHANLPSCRPHPHKTHTHSSASPIRSSLCSSEQLRLMCLSPRCVCQCFIQISLNPTNRKGGEKQPPSPRLHVSGAFSQKEEVFSNKLAEKIINSTLLKCPYNAISNTAFHADRNVALCEGKRSAKL